MAVGSIAAGLGAGSAYAGKLTDTAYGLPHNSPLAPNSNMVVNGDFETGSISPFTTVVNTGSGAINSTASFVHAGSFSARITTNSTANSSSGVGGGGGCTPSGVRI